MIQKNLLAASKNQQVSKLIWANRLISILVFFSFSFVSVPAWADDTTSVLTTTPTPSSSVQPPIIPVIMPMRPGAVVPWPGLLLNPAAVAQIKVELDSAKEQCSIVMRKAVDQQKAQDEFQLANQKAEAQRTKTILEASIKSKTEESIDLQKHLEQTEKDRPNVYLWAGLGTVAGVVMTVLTVFAVTQAIK